MITVNNIECKEGSASFDRSGTLCDEICITNARRNNEGLIESVKFIGTWVPINDEGKELEIKTEKEITNVYDQRF